MSIAETTTSDDWGDWGLESKPLPKTNNTAKYSVGLDGDDENMLSLIDQSSLDDEDNKFGLSPDNISGENNLNLDKEPL